MRQEMSVAEYCAWWRQHHVGNRAGTADDVSSSTSGVVSTATDIASDAGPGGGETSPDGSGDCRLWYLKDWHFSTDFPDYKARATALTPSFTSRFVSAVRKPYCQVIPSSVVKGARVRKARTGAGVYGAAILSR